MTDSQLINAATEAIIQLVVQNRPANNRLRAEVYYAIGKELLYLAAALSEDEMNLSQEEPIESKVEVEAVNLNSDSPV